MIPGISWTRRLGKLVRGDAAPKALFLGALIGAMLGMVPGFNLTMLLLILLFFVLAANMGGMMLGFLLGKTVCLLAAPWTFEIGYGMIHGNEALFASLATAPVIAWMDLDRYCLIGGLPIGVGLGLGLGVVCMAFVQSLRRSIMAVNEKSERARKLSSSRWLRIVFWIFFGKSKGELSDKLEKKKAPWLRKSGLAFVVIVLVLAVAVQFVFAGSLVRPQLEHQLSQSFGAEVNIGSADFSIFGGEVTLKDLQITDAEKPANNMMRAEELSAQLSFGDLLARRFVMDHLVGNGVKTDVPRDQPGFVLPKAEKEEKPKSDPESIDDYLEKIEQVKGYLEKVKEYLDREKEESEPPTEEDHERAREQARLQGYLVQSARGRLVKQPTFTIRRVELSGVEFKDVPGSYTLLANDLSTQPTLNELPMIFDVKAESVERSLVNLKLMLNEPSAKNLLDVFLPDVDLDAESLSDKAPLMLKGGKALIEGVGNFDADALFLPIRVSVQDLQAAVRGDEKVLGFEAGVANRIFESLKTLEFEAVLEGSLLAPKLKVDTEKLLANLQKTLLAQGEAELARLAGEQVAKVRALADEQIDKAKGQLEDAAKKALEGAGLDKKLDDIVPGAKEKLEGLIPGGKKKADGSKPEDAIDPGKVLDDLSKGLPFGKKKDKKKDDSR